MRVWQDDWQWCARCWSTCGRRCGGFEIFVVVGTAVVAVVGRRRLLHWRPFIDSTSLFEFIIVVLVVVVLLVLDRSCPLCASGGGAAWSRGRHWGLL
jgi:hypothetical protein